MVNALWLTETLNKLILSLEFVFGTVDLRFKHYQC